MARDEPVDRLRELVIHLLEENGFNPVVRSEEFSTVAVNKPGERMIWTMDKDAVEFVIAFKQGVAP